MDAARESYDAEVAFFEALIDSTAYVHIPVSDDGGSPRLISFNHPDGFMAIPIFTSMEKALFAATGAVRVVKVAVRAIFEGTPGATFMLNPNDGGPVLYPEEIQSMLENGFVARFEKARKVDDSQLLLFEPKGLPPWFTPFLAKFSRTMDFVEATYVVGMSALKVDEDDVLLIGLKVDVKNAERAARALMLALQQQNLKEVRMCIDLTIIDPSNDAIPAMWLDPAVRKIFDRSH